MRTVGVEEEFLLVERDTGRPRPSAPRVVPSATQRIDRSSGVGGKATAELDREQVETGTAPHRSLARLHEDLLCLRSATARAAADAGVALAASATSPVPADPSTMPDPRYAAMVEAFGLTAREQLTCGCHVHVGVADPEEAVGALDRIRPWFGPLIAISANSPFWQGEDTAYASYRTQVWGRWPTAGATGEFGSAAAYRACVDEMLATRTILDEGMIYFDARLSARHPTLEVRVADVCLRTADAVLLAALVRALVDTAAAEWAAGEPAPRVRPEVLRLAQWRAARSGVCGELVDVVAGRPVPAAQALHALVDHVCPALAEHGDLTLVTDGIAELLRRGTGADEQRAAFARRGRVDDVVEHVVATTLA